MLTIRLEPALVVALALSAALLVLNEVPRPPQLDVSWVTMLPATSALYWTLFAAEESYWWAALPGALLAAAGAASLVALIPDARGAWTPLHLTAVLAIGAWAATARATTRWRAPVRPGRRSSRPTRSSHTTAA